MVDPQTFISLTDEYNDLIEEYFDCGDHDERCRCGQRLSQIQSLLDSPEPLKPLID
jgi:hypothetical protein